MSIVAGLAILSAASVDVSLPEGSHQDPVISAAVVSSAAPVANAAASRQAKIKKCIKKHGKKSWVWCKWKYNGSTLKDRNYGIEIPSGGQGGGTVLG